MPIRKSSALVVLLMSFALANISAAATYTAANVKGSYSLLLNRWNGSTGDSFGLLGVVNFDGLSAVSGSVTMFSHGSLIVASISSGSTYSVSPNGSGSMTLNLSGGNGSGTFAFVLNSVSSNVAKSLQVLNLDANDVAIAGTANSINISGSATAAKLKGTYSLLLNWWTTTEPQQTLVGTIKFDGVSKVTLSFTDQQAGLPATTGTGSGTYSVNSDGSGSINLTLSNNTTKQLAFVLNSIAGTSVAKGLQLLDEANPIRTSVDTGTAVYE